MQSRVLPLLAAIAVLAAALIYLLNAGGHLMFDSRVALAQNAAIAIDGEVLDDWRRAALSSESGPLGRRIPMLSFAAQYAIQGASSPWALKAVNLLIHLLTAGLIFGFVRTCLSNSTVWSGSGEQASRIALVAALIWLLHPLHVSTVLYTVQRMAQFSTCFVLLGLWCYMHYRGRWARHAPTPGAVAAGALWYSLALLAALYSKENGVLLLWLTPLLEVCFFRGEWGGQCYTWLRRLAWCALVAPLVLFVVYMAVDGQWVLAGYAARDFGFEERLWTEARVLWRYLGWFMVPDLTAMGLHHDDIVVSSGWLQPITTLLAVLAWLGVIGVAVIFRNRWPLLIFALLFFLIGHSLESGPLALELVYEHRNYLPAVGLSVLLAALLVTGVEQLRTESLPAAVAIVLALLGVLLALRASHWSDEWQFAAHQAARHPESPRAAYHFANTTLRRAEEETDAEQARELFIASRRLYERLIELDPAGLVGPISLYYLDSRYFPALGQREDWLTQIEQRLGGGVLKAQDNNAFQLLTQCFEAGYCTAPRERVSALYQRAAEVPGSSLNLAALHARYLQAQGDLVTAQGILQNLVTEHPHYRPAYLRLMEAQFAQGERGQVVETAAALVRADTARRETATVRQLFVSESQP